MKIKVYKWFLNSEDGDNFSLLLATLERDGLRQVQTLTRRMSLKFQAATYEQFQKFIIFIVHKFLSFNETLI